MFMKISPVTYENNLMFRDGFIANLNEELFGRGKEVQEIIEVIFNLDFVLEIEPVTCSIGYPSSKDWVKLDILTKPMHTEEEVDKFADYLQGLSCVEFAQGVYWLNPTAEETLKHVYGGKRSKL